jgi:hypothetical protein
MRHLLVAWAAVTALALALAWRSPRENFDDDELDDEAAPQAAVTTRAFSPEELRPSRGGRVPPIVTKAGKRAFEVTYKKGQRGGGSSNSSFLIAPPGFFPTDEVRVSFKVWFDSSFPWDVNASTPQVGGKLGGFDIGEGASSGGNFSTGAASYRVTWKDGGGLLAYLYPATRQNFSKDANGAASWAVLDQTPGFQSVSRISSGIHVFVPPKKAEYKLLMRKEAWNDISMYIKLNAPGKYDGIMELTVNGATERIAEVRYRYTDIRVLGWLLHSFFGGSQRPPTDTKAWCADFEFEKKYM